MERKNMKMIAAVMVMMMMCIVAADAGMTCSMVSSNVASCISYLRRTGPLPPACCNGIGNLKRAASTPADRQIACNCLKSAATSISGIDYGLAAGLPSKCGVSIPYKISPTTDCTKVN